MDEELLAKIEELIANIGDMKGNVGTLKDRAMQILENADKYNKIVANEELDVTLNDGSVIPNYKKLVNHLQTVQAPDSKLLDGKSYEEFAPVNHTHTKESLGLSNVDNTKDIDKPISTITQEALDGKSDINHTHSNATQSASGLMSNGDKAKLDGIAIGANKYTLPLSSSTVLGGVKTRVSGSTLYITTNNANA
jgi:hypothetical protein